LFITALGLGLPAARAGDKRTDVNDIAESYVRLVLEIGLYDPDYVDAYFGPPEWQPPEDRWQETFPAERLGAAVDALLSRFGRIDSRRLKGLPRLRHIYLDRQLRSVRAKIDLMAGEKMPFDEESKALYDLVAPVWDEAHIGQVLKELDEALPGEEGLYVRFSRYIAAFTVPRDKMDGTLRMVIAAYRQRTSKHLALPPDEGVDVRFVMGKPWGAAATYQGNYFSRIDINVDAPFYVADAMLVAGHEVYPGHHVHLSLLEERLVRGRGWMEYSVLPLHSPLATVSEGFAEYGARDLVMTPAERLEFARSELFPSIGLDPNEAEKYFRIMDRKNELEVALVEAARQYLDGHRDRDQTHDWLRGYYLTTPSGADGITRFIEEYRTYVVNYSIGRRLIQGHIEAQARDGVSSAQRWKLFQTLLSTPQTPSELTSGAAGLTEP